MSEALQFAVEVLFMLPDITSFSTHNPRYYHAIFPPHSTYRVAMLLNTNSCETNCDPNSPLTEAANWIAKNLWTAIRVRKKCKM